MNRHDFALIMATLTTLGVVAAYDSYKRDNENKCYTKGKIVDVGRCDSQGLCGVMFQDLSGILIEQGLAKYPIVNGTSCIIREDRP
jgi:hypothetical protein